MDLQFFANLIGIFVWGGTGLALALAILTFPTVFFVYAVRYGWTKAYMNAHKKE